MPQTTETTNTTNTIGVSTFVQRQTPTSRFSHYAGDWNDLITLANQNFQFAKQGYRQGVLEVPVPSHKFYSSIVQLKSGDKLAGTFKPRKANEEPRKQTGVVGGEKIPAKSVTLILYHKDVLDEGNERSCNTNWEIISINANPEEGDMPMSPGTLMANHFQSSGGTKTNMSDGAFVRALKQSFNYWKDKALIAEITEE